MEYFDVSPSWRLKLRLAEELYDNHIFNVVVRTALERSNYKLLSLEDLLNQILSVALKEMRQVILDIHSQQIMLSTLDQLIAGNKMGKNTEIAEEFRKICDCLKILYETIEPGLELYRRYLSIRNSGSGAHTILKLVEKLNLKGNFEELRKVMALVNRLKALSTRISYAKCVIEYSNYNNETW